MASEDMHEENLELLRGLNLPKKVRDKLPAQHVGCHLPLHAITCEDWEPEEENPKHYDYPETNSGPLCHAEESGYLDSTDVFCPFADDYICTAGCPTNRERICINGE